MKKELAYLKRFEYEYFTVNLGEAPLMMASGSSINAGQSDAQQIFGIAYRLYACGIFNEKGDSPNPEIIIPLESIIIMPQII